MKNTKMSGIFMSKESYQEKVRHKLRSFYLVSMAAILLVSLIIYVLSSINVSRSTGIAEVINVAGSQRMLCQRVVLFLSMYERHGDRAFLDTAKESLERISYQQQSLIHPPGPIDLKAISTEDLVTLYNERGLNERLNRFLAVARRAMSTTDPAERSRLIKGMAIETQHRLLAELDEAVKLYILISNQRTSEKNITVNAFIVMIILTVILNFLFVFRPVQREVGSLIKRLDDLACLDSLTGILNRRSISEKLSEVHELFERYNHSYSICIVDLDEFKNINDTFGHQAGDIVLKHFCQITSKSLRACDYFGRYGGEEFLIIISESTPTDCLQVAEKVRIALESSTIQLKNTSIDVTASLGCATIRPHESVSNLVKRADEAVYKAKELGRNQSISSDTLI